MKHLWMIAYFFPPKGGVPVRRVLRLLRHLPAHGWRCSVLTADRPYDPHHPDDLEAMQALPACERVVRAPAHSVLERLTVAGYRGLGRLRSQPATARDVAGGGLRRGLNEWLAFPDFKRGWARSLRKQAHAVARQDAPDAIWATGYPWSALDLADRLGRDLGVPHLLDFRDAWSMNPRGLWTGSRQQALEARLVSQADAVIAATDWIRDGFQERYGSQLVGELLTLTNAYDPHEQPEADPTLNETHRLVITYTGTFNDAFPPSPQDQSPYSLIEAVSQLEDSERAGLLVRLVGRLSPAYRREIERRGLQENIQWVAPVSHQRALQHQQAADVLLVITAAAAGAEGILTGKLVEYFGAKKPVWVLAPEGEASRQLLQRGCGWVDPPQDRKRIADRLRQLLQQRREGTLPEQAPEVPEFCASELTARFAELLNRTLAKSATRALSALLLLGLLLGSSACGRGDSDSSPGLPPGPEIHDGYPARVDADGTRRSGWSVLPGETLTWFLNAERHEQASVRITDTLANVIDQVETQLAPQRPSRPEPWRNGFGYQPTFQWKVPDDLPSGVYYLENRSDLFFVVREPEPEATILLLMATNTFNAYTTSGGKSLYKHPTADYQGDVVSFLRPFNKTKPVEWRASIDWLAQESLAEGGIAYLTDHDMRKPENLSAAKLLIILGHSEYWDARSRRSLDGFIDRGGHVVLLSGNTMWWQVRFNADETQLVCFKSFDDDPIEDPKRKTARWSDPRIGLSEVTSIGGSFLHGGYGEPRRPQGRGWHGLRIMRPDSPIFVGLGLRSCDHLPIRRHHESDGMPILGLDGRGFPVPDLERLQAHRAEIIAYDWGHRAGHTLATMHLMQRAPDSGIVFHAASKDFGGKSGVGGPDQDKFRGIVRNAVSLLLGGEDPFLGGPLPPLVFPMQTPYKGKLPEDLHEVCPAD